MKPIHGNSCALSDFTGQDVQSNQTNMHEKALKVGQPMIGRLIPAQEDNKGKVIVDCLFAMEGGA